MKSFEVICSNGEHFRSDDGNHRWEYGLVPGSIDEDDRSVVHIVKVMPDDEEALVITITDVIAVGTVDAMTALRTPRLKLHRVCPRCGYIED